MGALEISGHQPRWHFITGIRAQHNMLVVALAALTKLTVSHYTCKRRDEMATGTLTDVVAQSPIYETPLLVAKP